MKGNGGDTICIGIIGKIYGDMFLIEIEVEKMSFVLELLVIQICYMEPGFVKEGSGEDVIYFKTIGNLY